MSGTISSALASFRHLSLSSYARRYASAAAESSTSAHPFSRVAHIPSSPRIEAPAGVLHPKRGQALIHHINAELEGVYDSSKHLKRTFSRRHPMRAKPGAVVSVTSWTSPAKVGTSTFSGILLGVSRASIDTSFKLRNVVGRVGIEQSFKVCSPLIKEIKVIKNADGERKGGLRDLKRAKVNYLRDRPELLSQIAGALKTQNQKRR